MWTIGIYQLWLSILVDNIPTTITIIWPRCGWWEKRRSTRYCWSECRPVCRPKCDRPEMENSYFFRKLLLLLFKRAKWGPSGRSFLVHGYSNTTYLDFSACNLVQCVQFVIVIVVERNVGRSKKSCKRALPASARFALLMELTL